MWILILFELWSSIAIVLQFSFLVLAVQSSSCLAPLLFWSWFCVLLPPSLSILPPPSLSILPLNKMLQAPLEYSLPFGGTVILGNTALSADLLPLTRVLLGRRGNVFTPKAHTWMHHVCVCKQCVLRRKTMSPMKALFQSYLDPV